MKDPHIFGTVEIVAQGHDWAKTMETFEARYTANDAIEYAITGGYDLLLYGDTPQIECDHHSNVIRVFVEPKSD
jgi:hypothetical protein